MWEVLLISPEIMGDAQLWRAFCLCRAIFEQRSRKGRHSQAVTAIIGLLPSHVGFTTPLSWRYEGGISNPTQVARVCEV
jgi:hypothetical protein